MKVVGYLISSWILFWLVDDEVIRSQHYSPSGPSRPGVYMLVDSILPLGGGFNICRTVKRIRLRILFTVLEEGPWLCLMAKLLFFYLVDSFPFFLYFLTSLIKFVLWNLGEMQEAKVFLYPRSRQRTWGSGLSWEDPKGGGQLCPCITRTSIHIYSHTWTKIYIKVCN